MTVLACQGTDCAVFITQHEGIATVSVEDLQETPRRVLASGPEGGRKHNHVVSCLKRGQFVVATQGFQVERESNFKERESAARTDGARQPHQRPVMQIVAGVGHEADFPKSRCSGHSIGRGR